MRLLVGLLLAVSLSFGAAAQSGPVNLDFDRDQPGSAPSGWTFNAQQAGARAHVVGDERKNGLHALVISRDAAAALTSPAILLQSFDATPFRGKRVRYRAASRVDAGAVAQLWLRVDLPAINGRAEMGFFDNMDDRPISSRDWTHHEIVGDVAPNAARIFLGAMAFGPGRVWLDAGSFEVVGEAETRTVEGPRPLTDRGLANLTAFTRLLGYVRHFHPSDEAARADWSSVAVAGVRIVEASPDAASLARQLAAVFSPLAPTVEISIGSVRPSPGAKASGEQRALVWRHLGFAQGTSRGIYRSERTRVVAAAEVFQQDLGGGVSARIPLAVAVDDVGTLPLPHMTVSTRPVAPQPTREVLAPEDRAVRLAGVALTWNVLQHFYPYFDVVQTDWPRALEAGLREAAIAYDERGYAETLRRMIVQLHDGHGRISSRTDTPFLPAIAWEWIEQMLVVVGADESTTLRPGDVVRAIDGVPVEKVLAEREALISGATPQWIRHRATQELAFGLPGMAMTLDVERFGAPDRPERLVVVRGSSPQPYVERRPGKLTEIEPGIFYVDLDRASDADIADALPRLVNASGIVFDLRGYPRLSNPMNLFGHLSEAPMSSAQWHVPEIGRPNRERMTFMRSGEWQIPPQAPYLRARKVFITDGRAISYAETLMGIVEHYQLGAIVGSPTAGTNGNIITFAAPGNVGVIFTGMKVLKHDGSRHHGAGIQPTVPVARTRAAVAAGRDELLERAIAAARGAGATNR